MPIRLKLTALATTGLAACFYWFFMFTKHDPVVAPIVPFGEDPYDAMGSFCLIVTILLGLISVVRAFRPYKAGHVSPARVVYLLRTEAAIPLGVLITLAGDATAMIRHPDQWIGKPQAAELFGLMAGMTILALAVLIPISRSAREFNFDGAVAAWPRALLTTLAALVVLAIVPISFINSPLLHFLIIVLADLLIAAPMAAFIIAVAPYRAVEMPSRRAWIPFIVSSALGIALGGLVLAGEVFGEGSGSIPRDRLLLVAAMFIGAGTSALLIGYGFMRKPLGLFRYTAAETPLH